MKIARIEMPSGHRAWAVVDLGAGTVRRIAGGFSEWAPSTAATAPEVVLEGPPLNLNDVRLLAPIEPGGRIFGVATNYHARSGSRDRKDRSPHPFAYIRPDSAIVHPEGELRYPTVARELDCGLELVAVVARRLGTEPQPTACLLGYAIGNGISARDPGGDRGGLDLFTEKALDRTVAIGPWVTTLDELGGPGQPQTDFEMRVNGEVRQLDNTGNMIFTVDELLGFIDIRVALQPGDLVFTGTPSSVGVEQGRLLQPGDRLVSEIEPIGVLRNVVGPREPSPAGRLGRSADKDVGTARPRAQLKRRGAP